MTYPFDEVDKETMNNIIAIDRDGVIFDCPKGKYINTVEDIRFIAGSLEAIVAMQNYGLTPIIVTNQAGLAYGYTSKVEYTDICDIIQRELARRGGHFMPILTCPHSKEANCGCRKPNAGLLYKAEGKFNGKVSWVVGDYWSDIFAGKAIQAMTILTMTGRGADDENIMQFENTGVMPDEMVDNLWEASRIIIGNYLHNQSCKVFNGIAEGYKLYDLDGEI
jgi:D-glycero-D-manno-heptose 1,7-bisphosphate phosphatase